MHRAVPEKGISAGAEGTPPAHPYAMMFRQCVMRQWAQYPIESHSTSSLLLGRATKLQDHQLALPDIEIHPLTFTVLPVRCLLHILI